MRRKLFSWLKRSWIPCRQQGLGFKEFNDLEFLILTEIEIRLILEYVPGMAETVEPVVLPDIEKEEQTGAQSELEPGYLVICWDDPVNLMDYVTHVFQVVFGWPKPKAQFHMLQVHNQGKSVLTRESMERAEHYVHQLQTYSLHATMERDE
jgi:ATP-dependent Clp protease adaptor protein ClpS